LNLSSDYGGIENGLNPLSDAESDGETDENGKIWVLPLALLAVLFFSCCTAVAPVAAQTPPDNQTTLPAVTDANYTIVTTEFHGKALIKLDNNTMKVHPVDTPLTLELGATINDIVRVHNVGGTVDINGVTYTIESGKGRVNLVKNTASLCCNGIDPSGSELHFLLRSNVTFS